MCSPVHVPIDELLQSTPRGDISCGYTLKKGRLYLEDVAWLPVVTFFPLRRYLYKEEKKKKKAVPVVEDNSIGVKKVRLAVTAYIIVDSRSPDDAKID